MATCYFSDRDQGAKARVRGEISGDAWLGISGYINDLVDRGAFGKAFPAKCHDDKGTVGTERSRMNQALAGQAIDLTLMLDPANKPDLSTIMDLVEFCYERVAWPVEGDWHAYFSHHHLTFDQAKGRLSFYQNINQIFARHGLTFDLQANGHIIRTSIPAIGETIEHSIFATGDTILDGMLETARQKFADPNDAQRLEALKTLWEAFERIKTIEPGVDKKKQASDLIDRLSSEAKFRTLIDSEFLMLTKIGNDFMIRHSETNKTPISDPLHIEYIFHRAFSLIFLALKATGRVR